MIGIDHRCCRPLFGSRRSQNRPGGPPQIGHGRRDPWPEAVRHPSVVQAFPMGERGVVSLGVAASIGPELAALLAPAAERAGFHALWVNDTPGADALAVLAAAARTTERLTLATGVLPIDRRSAAEIALQVAARGLPQDRLVLGIGSGRTASGALRLVADAAAELRSAVTATVVVGALGPRMRALAVEESDGVLLSWLTPAVARDQAAVAHASAPHAHVALYIRTDPRRRRARAPRGRNGTLRGGRVLRRELRAAGHRPRRHRAECRHRGCRCTPRRVSARGGRGRSARDHGRGHVRESPPVHRRRSVTAAAGLSRRGPAPLLVLTARPVNPRTGRHRRA